MAATGGLAGSSFPCRISIGESYKLSRGLASKTTGSLVSDSRGVVERDCCLLLEAMEEAYELAELL